MLPYDNMESVFSVFDLIIPLTDQILPLITESRSLIKQLLH